MMSIRLNLAAFSTAALLCMSAAQAQQGAPSVDDVVQMMSVKLNLTDAQRNAIAPVIADRREKLKSLLDDGAPMRAHRREARSILTESDKRINAVLSPDQQKQYAELEQQMIDRLRQRSSSQ